MGPGEPAATSANFVSLSADIGAHENGHGAGLLHIDSFGPITYGVHNPPGVTKFLPPYPGAEAAWETPQHIISSPAAVGSTTAISFVATLDEIRHPLRQQATIRAGS